MPLVTGPAHTVGVGPAGVQGGVHVRHLALQQLELPDPLTELFPGVGVVEGGITSRLHDPEGTSGEDQPLQVEAGEEDVDPLVDLAQNILCRYLAVLENQLAGPTASDAELILFLAQ